MPSEAPPPKRRKKGRGRLAGIFAAILIIAAVLLFVLLQVVPSPFFPTTTTGSNTLTTGPSTPRINIQFTPSTAPNIQRLAYVTTIPVAVSFTAVPSGSGYFSYLWNFGDGENSTSRAITHVFATNCVYDVTLNVTNTIGPTTSGAILFSVFSYKRTGGEMVLCPQQGTAGITPVELGGGFYAASSKLGVQVDNVVLRNMTTDVNGDWALNVTRHLPPEVNGVLYNFTTSPHSVKCTFLTLEGIRAAPTKGEPGDPFTLEGRSYPASTIVSIYLGGEYVGQALTDEHGTFLANLTVPSSIHYAGRYKFSTSPPVLGAQATFRVPVSSVTPAPPPLPFWPWILVIPGAAIPILLFFLWRRRRPVDLEVFQQQVTTPFSSLWAIRVWAKNDMARCRITYDNTPLQTLVPKTGASLEMPLRKGECLDFRIPDTLTILLDAWVVVKDGDKTVISQKFGDIPHAKS